MGKKIKEQEEPVFTIGIMSRLLQVTQTTLRIWEKKGLIKPRRLGKNRYYSQDELNRLREIKCLLQEKGLNIAGVKEVLDGRRCWVVKKCGDNKFACAVYLNRRHWGLKCKV